MSLAEKMAKIREREGIEIVGEKIEEYGEGQYVWKPDTIGDEIEGKVTQILEGEFGEQIEIEIEDTRHVELPAHADLKKKTKEIYEGDYVWVELYDYKKSNNPEYSDKPMYRVTVVPADKVPGED